MTKKREGIPSRFFVINLQAKTYGTNRPHR
jgi:hypothetical protein